MVWVLSGFFLAIVIVSILVGIDQYQKRKYGSLAVATGNRVIAPDETDYGAIFGQILGVVGTVVATALAAL